jgi:DmsE family decaheme c-type cytochrome
MEGVRLPGSAAPLLTLSLFLLPLAAAQTEPAQPAPAAAGGFVGSNVCKTCHADLWMNFYKNAHYRSIASAKEPPAKTGCEGCHGPGSAHVAAQGGKQSIPRAFSLMQPKQVIETCLECHGRDLARTNVRKSEHTMAGVACTSCHSIHHSPVPKYLLAKKQADLCYGCHATVKAEFSLPSKHRVNEGFMQCTDCHNPHGSIAPTWRMANRPRLTEAALGVDEPCVKCHVDKRGPFVFEHAPVRVEGCETCHFPHGSVNTRLLRKPVVFTLCLECHNGTGAGTRNNGVPTQTNTHNMLDPKFQFCTTCHVRIHGSNADERFFR